MDGAFLGSVALACLLVALILTQLGSLPARKAATITATPTAASGIAQTAKVRQYQVAADAGLMQPSVDADGNVWVGEMGTNHLTRIDASSGAVTSWTPPGGQYNIMATAPDKQGNIWFTEQAANYIGRFDPRTEQFTTYPLDSENGQGMGPQDLRFDSSGKLWFTLLSGGRIGRLDPASGAIQTWAVPAPRDGVKSYPFALAITPDGPDLVRHAQRRRGRQAGPRHGQGDVRATCRRQGRGLLDGERRRRQRLVHRDAGRQAGARGWEDRTGQRD